jgi:isoleucyl-tRNA synthetase
MSIESPASHWPSWPVGTADSLETELLARWREEGLFSRVQERGADRPGFVFFEGPPTANGRPGIHHVFARTIKDLICRYQTMNGHRVTRIAGWDTHGLPVELEVEKQLGFAGKQDIERYGVARFAEACLASVFTYRDEWTELSERIGYWLDYDRAYYTCSRDYVESVWHLLQRLHQRQMLTRGHRVLPYCPRCGTVLSSHELALGYQDVRDKAVYVTAPLMDDSGRELVIWTTTPWTLPSNVAIAAHPELDYAEFTSSAAPGRRFVAAAARVEAVGALLGGEVTVARRFPGRELVGASYQRPLDVVPLPAEGESQLVVAGEFVTATDGSGLVHLAPAFGADDFAAGQAHGLAMLRPVASDGTFTGTTWPELEGRLVTDGATNDLIIRRLKEVGRHLRTDAYDHSYPHCWRCGSKLIYYARDSWFVRTSAVKARMQQLNADIDWHPPEVGTGRFGEWLGNNVDWALSRDRYWGTPLPIWVNDRDPDDVVVIGSIAELEALAGPLAEGDLGVHKPWIDDRTWPAPGGGTYRRTPEVIDTWFDSGSMPWAQWHWPFEHQAEQAAHFPADFICEGVDQTRGWFYSMLAIATSAFDVAPYRHVIVNELVLDDNGQKMSKSRGNVVNPWDLVAEHGADAARLYLLLSSQVWQPKRFDATQIADVAGGLLTTLRASYHFFSLYAGPLRPAPPAGERPLADRWILGRLDATTAQVRAGFGGYDVTTGLRALVSFVVDDLSNWYVRLGRERFWAADGQADPAAVATLHEVLTTVARLLAPAAPFAADWLHRALTGDSVHLAAFPDDRGRLDPDLDWAMDGVRRLASLGRAAREKAALRVRQPLARMKVAVPAAVRGEQFDALLSLLAAETNVKAIEVVSSDAELVRLRGTPNFRALGKRYGAEVPAVAAWVATLDGTALRRLEQGGTVDDRYHLEPGDVVIVREVVTPWPVASDGPFVAALDPEVDDALRREGLAREVVSRVQRLRRDAGYQVTTRIALHLRVDGVLADAVRTHREWIAGEVLARELEVGSTAAHGDRSETVDIDDHTAVLTVRRFQDDRTASGPAEAGEA